MCTRPLKLNLNKDGYRHIVGCRDSIVVPCGKCKECIDAKVDSLYQRNYLEYQHCIKSGGYAFFDTLTYNDKCLPIYEGKQYFSRRDLTATIKRLRSALVYAGFKDKVRFFFIVEYGEKFDRVHGHILFYVYDKALSPMHLHMLLCKAWRYGYCDSLFATYEHVLTSPAAIKYIMKYLQKTFEYEHISPQQTVYDTAIGYQVISDDSAHRNYRPFYRCSINLGYYPDENNYSSRLRIGTINGYEYQEPCFYFLRKVFLDKSVTADGSSYLHTDAGSYCYHLNAVGLSYRVSHLEDSIYRRCLSLSRMYQRLGDNLKVRVNDLLNYRDLHDLAVYDCVYRGVAYSPLFPCHPLTFEDYLQDYIDILTWQKNEVANIQYDEHNLFENLSPKLNQYHYICATDYPMFQGFDAILDILYRAKCDDKLEQDSVDTEFLHSVNRLRDNIRL